MRPEIPEVLEPGYCELAYPAPHRAPRTAAPRRVVVTGAGIVCPIGKSFSEFAGGLRECRSGLVWTGPSEPARATGLVLGRVPHIARTKHHATYASDPITVFAFEAATQARAQAGWLDVRPPFNVGLFIGTALGGVESFESCCVSARSGGVLHPDVILQAQAGAPAARIANRCGEVSPSITYSSGCASSMQAIGEAFLAIRSGRLDHALAGGTEACLSNGALWGWHARPLDFARHDPDSGTDPTTICRPFSRDRRGMVLGEGAAMFTVEELNAAKARGAPILCELLGYACTSTGYHIAHDFGLISAMRAALADAGLTPADIDYIAAHGTGTTDGDAAEARAIHRAYGRHAPFLAVSSTKALHGHLLGASGALGFASGLVVLQHGFLPATCNMTLPCEDLDFVPNKPRIGVSVRRFMANSFGYGCNAVLIAGRIDDDD